MDSLGPATKQRMQAIKRRVEEIGRDLGVPDDMAVRYVEIDTRQQLTEELHSLHEDEKQWRRKVFDPWAFLRTIAATIVGEIDAHRPKK